jgi:hypothetical protein
MFQLDVSFGKKDGNVPQRPGNTDLMVNRGWVIFIQCCPSVSIVIPKPQDAPSPFKVIKWYSICNNQHTSSYVLYLLASINCAIEFHCDVSIHTYNVL